MEWKNETICHNREYIVLFANIASQSQLLTCFWLQFRLYVENSVEANILKLLRSRMSAANISGSQDVDSSNRYIANRLHN